MGFFGFFFFFVWDGLMVELSFRTSPLRFFSYTATEDGISIVADEETLNHFPQDMLDVRFSVVFPSIPLKCYYKKKTKNKKKTSDEKKPPFPGLQMGVNDRPLRLIQVDLAQFGLDRYGIVYSMSDPLATENINLLYLSTYKTANILVSIPFPFPSFDGLLSNGG
jgi:hypothetical protein